MAPYPCLRGATRHVCIAIKTERVGSRRGGEYTPSTQSVHLQHHRRASATKLGMAEMGVYCASSVLIRLLGYGPELAHINLQIAFIQHYIYLSTKYRKYRKQI